jgi:hypothetical protein
MASTSTHRLSRSTNICMADTVFARSLHIRTVLAPEETMKAAIFEKVGDHWEPKSRRGPSEAARASR